MGTWKNASLPKVQKKIYNFFPNLKSNNETNEKVHNISLNQEKILVFPKHTVLKGLPFDTMTKNLVFVSQFKLNKLKKPDT